MSQSVDESDTDSAGKPRNSVYHDSSLNHMLEKLNETTVLDGTSNLPKADEFELPLAEFETIDSPNSPSNRSIVLETPQDASDINVTAASKLVTLGSLPLCSKEPFPLSTPPQRFHPAIQEPLKNEDGVAEVCSPTDTATSGGWEEMPVYTSEDIWDDNDKLIAAARLEEDEEEKEKEKERVLQYAQNGYTRVTVDEEDADSIESLEDKTDFLFHQAQEGQEDDPDKNPLSQLENTKQLLTDSEKVAYVSLCRLCCFEMATELANKGISRKLARNLSNAYGSMAVWGQKIMVRLYAHMDISPEEQIMIEQLSHHGVESTDLAPTLLRHAKVFASESFKVTPVEGGESQDGEVDQAVKTTFTRLSDDSEQLPPTVSYTLNDDTVKNPLDISNGKELDIDIRWTVLCDLFLVLIADSIYDARSRTLLIRVGDALKLSWLDICKFERRITEALEIEESPNQDLSEKQIIEKRRKRALKKKYIYMGLATVGGGLIIGLSAGFLAPVIGAGLAAGFTTIGIAGTSGFLAGAGGTAIVTTTGTIVGAAMGSKGMNRRMGHVKTFEFRPLHNKQRMNLIITIAGWMADKEEDVRLPFSTVDPVMGDLFSVLWEPEMLTSMGQTINILATEVLTNSVQHILAGTVLTALMSAMQVPLMLTKLSYLLDNPWNVSLDRAWAGGKILADTLISRNLGQRPVTLVGFSLGARVIISCLNELARKGAYGLVENVYIFGTPIVVKKRQFILISSMISGRFVNGYSTHDWLLAYLFRATSGGIGRIAGLAPIKYHGVENFDCSGLVEGHLGYREAVPRLLKAVGWKVLSEDFGEVDAPDPDKHREKQRELIHEVDDARKSASTKKKNRFVAWLMPRKKEWLDMTSGAASGNLASVNTKDDDDDDDVSTKNGDDIKEDGTSDYYDLGEPRASEDTVFDVLAIKDEIARVQAEEGDKAQQLDSLKLDKEEDSKPFSDGLVFPKWTNRHRWENAKKEDIEMIFDSAFGDDSLERNGDDDDYDGKTGTGVRSSTPVIEKVSQFDASRPVGMLLPRSQYYSSRSSSSSQIGAKGNGEDQEFKTFKVDLAAPRPLALRRETKKNERDVSSSADHSKIDISETLIDNSRSNTPNPFNIASPEPTSDGFVRPWRDFTPQPSSPREEAIPCKEITPADKSRMDEPPQGQVLYEEELEEEFRPSESGVTMTFA